ncbi:acetyl-hydrolase [Desulfosarcina variabilis str. Montpellier]
MRSWFCRLIIKKVISPKLNNLQSIDETRNFMEKMAKYSKLPPGTQIEKITLNGIAAEWIYTNTAHEERVVLFLHGGGYNLCSINTHRELASYIARESGAKVLLIDYRLSPEHPFPAALEDAVSAYHWLLGNGLSGKNIAIAGDSAGGGLTLATAISIRDAGDPLPSSIACIAPWTDLCMTGDSIQTKSKIDPLVKIHSAKIWAKNYIGDNDPSDPRISPLYADLNIFPPLLIHVGTDDMLLDDSKRIAQKAEESGVNVELKIYEKMWHVFHLQVKAMPEAKNAIAEFGAFIKKHFDD